MSKSSQNHSFDVKIACHIGILAATVLNHIHYWIKHNHIEGTGQAEEKTWTFQSVTKMQEYLPYLTEKQVRTSLDALEEHGYIIKGNFNKNRFDHTAWYTLPEDALTSIVIDLPHRANRSSEKGKSTSPPRQIQSPPKANLSYSKDMKEDMEQQQAAVVVPPDQQSFELLKAQGFDDKTAQSLARFPVDRIMRQVRHLAIAMDEASIDKPLGWLRNAIENDWQPAEKKPDPALEAAGLRQKQLEERTEIKLQCEDLHDDYESRFTATKYFIIGEDVLTMRSGDKNFGIPYDNGTVKTLKRFIEIEGL